MTLGMSSQLQLDSWYEGRPPTIHVAGLPVLRKVLVAVENQLILLMFLYVILLPERILNPGLIGASVVS